MAEEQKRIGSFVLERELAHDELGAWYRAVDDRLGRVVALRVWRFGGSASELRMAVRERARAAAAVVHPNLPTVYAREASRRADVLSTEFIEGDTVAEIVASGRRWRPLDAARLTIGLADALSAAHAANVTHGRIAPALVRVTPEGRAVLLGLGVATRPAEAQADPADPAAKEADVRALAHVLSAMCAAPPDPSAPWDPMLAVEAGLIEPVLDAALRDKRPIDAASFRDALVQTTTPAGPSRRPSVPFERLDPTAPHMVPELPRSQPGQTRQAGLLTVFVPEDSSPPSHRGVLARVGTGVLLGALLGLVSVGAFRAGIFERDGMREALEPAAETLQHVVGMVAQPGDQEPVASPLEVPAEDDTTTEIAMEQADTTPASVAAPPVPPPAPPPAPEAPASNPRSSADTRARTPPPAPRHTASVYVSPADALISRVDNGAFLGLGSSEVSVAEGDSVLLAFNRAGYVAERRAFHGQPMSVTLRPDSVQVTFTANVPVEVMVESSAGARMLGTTNLTARLPRGGYVVRFRAPNRPDWSERYDFPRAGASYRVSKMDFPTRGSLIVTVQGGWARVSVNGGPQRETPARFENLPDAPHIVRVLREGYQSIVDTVRVSPGQTESRQYRLRPNR